MMTLSLEYINCDLCGADNTEFLFYDNAFKLVRCKDCGLVYLNPRPKDTAIDSIDNMYYRDYIANEDGFAAEARDLLNDIKRYKKGGAILDVGCGAGFFLKAAEVDNWEVCGVEISQHLSNYAREKFGLNVFIGSLEKANFADGYFDVVTILDLLSHLRRPTETLKRAARLLKRDGLLVVKGGNRGELKVKAGQVQWGGPDHLYHFSRKTLQMLLEKCGFRIIKMYSEAILDGGLNSAKLKLSGKQKALLAGPYRALRKIARSTIGRVLGYFPVDSIIMIYALRG